MSAAGAVGLRFGNQGLILEARANGTQLGRCAVPLHAYPSRITDRLLHWADRDPRRVLFAQRPTTVGAAARRPDGAADQGARASGPSAWRTISYSAAVDAARALGQALLECGVSVERPLVVLSENDLEHGLLTLAALFAGVPIASISPAYSLQSRDFAKLKHVLGVLTPGLVFAASGRRFAGAIDAAVDLATEVVVTAEPLAERRCVSFDQLRACSAGTAIERAHAEVGPDTITRFLFTSGSTGLPKAVINTQRMWCSNQQMIAQALPILAQTPPLLVDWLPWNHTFGGNHNLGIGPIVHSGRGGHYRWPVSRIADAKMVRSMSRKGARQTTRRAKASSAG